MMRAPSSLKKFVVAPATRICSGWPPLFGNRRAPGTERGGEISERRGGLELQVAEVRRRERPILDVPRAQLAPHDDETRRVRVRKRTKQDRIHDTENRRAGSDAERDRDRRDGRKPDVLAQPARGVGQVSEQRIHRCVLGTGTLGTGGPGFEPKTASPQ